MTSSSIFLFVVLHCALGQRVQIMPESLRYGPEFGVFFVKKKRKKRKEISACVSFLLRRGDTDLDHQLLFEEKIVGGEEVYPRYSIPYQVKYTLFEKIFFKGKQGVRATNKRRFHPSRSPSRAGRPISTSAAAQF